VEFAEGPPTGSAESLTERVDSLATWVNDLEERLRVAEVATGDEKTAKELRKALEALSKHDPKLEKRVTDHVTVVTQRFDTLAGTVAATAASLTAREGEIASLRRELQEAEKRVAELARQAGGGADANEVARLRGIVDALSAQRPTRSADSRVDELGARMRMLAERVDSLTATVSANASAAGKRDNDLAAFRERLDLGARKIETVASELHRLQNEDSVAARVDALQVALVEANGAIADREQEAEQLKGRIDEAYARVGDVVTELQRVVGDLAGQVRELQSVPETAATALAERSAVLDSRIDTVAERIEAVAADVETSVARIAERDAQLTGLYRDVEAERARVDGVVRELREQMAALPDEDWAKAEIDARLETVRECVLAVVARLEGIEAQATEAADAESTRAAELDDALAAFVVRLDALDSERETAAEQLRRADEVWLQERDWVRRQLERLAEAQEEAQQADGEDPAVEELRTRLDELDSSRAAAGAQLEALAEAVAAASAADLMARLEELESRASALVSERAALGARVEASDRVVSEVASRLEELDARGSALASERAAVDARLEAGDQVVARLATRFEELDARGSAIASDRAAMDARLEASDLLVAGVASRLEELESRGSAVLSEHAVVGERMDATDSLVAALTARLGELESRGSAVLSEHAVVGERMDATDSLVAALTARLGELESRGSSVLSERAALGDRLEAGDKLVAEVASRLEELETRASAVLAERAAVGELMEAADERIAALVTRLEELESRGSAVLSERAALSDKLAASDRLVAAVASRVEQLEERASTGTSERTALGERFAATDRLVAAVASRLEELESRGSTVRSELAAVGERIDAVGAAASAEGAARLETTTRLVAQLAARLETLEQEPSDATIDEVLSERIEELTTRLQRVESAAQSAAAAAAVAAASSPEDGLEEIRTLVDGVVARVATNEQSLASLAPGTEALRPALDELRRRVESAERAASQVVVTVPTDGVEQGDGRFRLELRSLELRMEHAEAAARENREAVLTQLERLASRVEWRLQRLEEAAQAGSYVEPETGAEIVPIRGGADT
jgi:chromosome segregation ATPase